MSTIDISKPDSYVGLMISDEIVEQLRAAIEWVRAQRRLGMKEIAAGSGVPEHTVRNFAYRRSNRPSNLVLGRLYKYFIEHSGLLPNNLLLREDTKIPPSKEPNPGILARYGLVRRELPISEEDLTRVYRRYVGYYLCFARLGVAGRLSVSWLHIRSLNPKLSASRERLPLARFTWLLRGAADIDPRMRGSIVVGYVFSRRGKLFFTGQHDGELQYLTLLEPRGRRFTFLQGLCLLTSPDSGQLIADRLVCQYLGTEVARSAWEEKIGIFSPNELERNFDHADAILRVLSGFPAVTVDAGDIAAAEAARPVSRP